MNSHYLDHIVVESTDNLHFVIIDCSTYNPDLATPVAYYDVFVPNFTNPVSVQYTPTENLVVNSTVLEFTTFDNFTSLPDGLYTIKQKIVSGDETICYNSKPYFRINNLKNQILTKIQTALDDCNCEDANKYYQWLQDLELAKMMAENLCQTSRAIILFNSISEQTVSCPTCNY